MGFIFHRLRMCFWTAFYHTLGRAQFASLARGARFHGWIDCPQRGGRIRIGRGVQICPHVEISVLSGAEVNLGEGVFLGRGTIISAHRRISLGAHVLVAEYVSIHDHNYGFADPTRRIGQQGFDAEPIDIGEDSWIGAHAVLVKGAGLGRRCVLGAGAVLTRKMNDHTLAVGVPARARKSRDADEMEASEFVADSGLIPNGR